MHIVGKLRRIDEDSSRFYSVLKHLNKIGVDELKDLKIDFSYPKSTTLIKELIQGASFFYKNCIKAGNREMSSFSRRSWYCFNSASVEKASTRSILSFSSAV